MRVFWRIMYTKIAIFFHLALTKLGGDDTLYVTIRITRRRCHDE